MPSDCDGPITFGRVLPMQAILDYIDNAADDAPLVDARQARRQGDKRRDHRYLTLAEHKQIIHRGLSNQGAA